MEARSSINNRRIVGVPEDQLLLYSGCIHGTERGSQSVERAAAGPHSPCSSTDTKTRQKAWLHNKLHYHMGCVDILRRARAQQQIKVGDTIISVLLLKLSTSVVPSTYTANCA